MANTRDKPACDGSKHTVVVEIFFAFFYLFLIEHTELAELTVGKAIYNRSAKIVACNIVDGGTGIGSQRSEQDNKEYIKVAIGSMIGSWRHN